VPRTPDTYAQALFVLDSGSPLTDLVDQANDERRLLLSAERLPKRVASPKGRVKRSTNTAAGSPEDNEASS